MKVALTIAGSDSSGGAGIQADLKTFQALGVFRMSAVTAVTVQNTIQVYDIQEMRPQVVYDQIRCLFDDIEIHAVKIGMVGSIPLIEAVAWALNGIKCPPVVLDPVMMSKSGYRLLKEDAQQALIRNLFPLADVVTPNVHEAQALAGKEILDVETMRSAARQIFEKGAKKVVVKGGHLGGDYSTDVIFDGNRFMELTHRRIFTHNTHGTGCTFSSAVAAFLAQGKDFFDAVKSAKEYVTGAIENALSIGKGRGPTNHFYALYAKAGIS